MRKALIAFSIVTALLPLTLVEAAAPRPSCSQLRSLWPDYHSDFGVQWSVDEFSCNSKSRRMAEVFYYLENMAYQGIQIPNNYDFPNFYKFIYLNNGGFVFKKNATVPSETKAGKIYLGKHFFTKYVVEQQIATIVHEARHTKSGDDPGHVTCRRGVLSGRGHSCDSRFYDKYSGGAYTFEFHFLRIFRDHSYGHSLSKKIAHKEIKYMLHNRFNSISNSQIRKYSRWNNR